MKIKEALYDKTWHNDCQCILNDPILWFILPISYAKWSIQTDIKRYFRGQKVNITSLMDQKKQHKKIENYDTKHQHIYLQFPEGVYK